VDHVILNERKIINNNFGKLGIEEKADCFQALPENLAGGTMEKHVRFVSMWSDKLEK
jgi:hypothetical protein